MKKTISKIVLLLGLAALPAISAPLDSVAVGTWLSFGWLGAPGAHAFGGFADYVGTMGTPVFSTRTCSFFHTDPDCAFSGAYTLTITDLFFDGDQFEVFDNGVSLGTTSVPTNTITTCGDDPAACTGAAWTHGTFNLGAGSHQLDIVLISQAVGTTSGRGALIFNAAVTPPEVPEPATFGLIGLGLVGVAFRLRKKRA